MSALITTDIFVIPVLERYLVYAPLRRAAFLTNAAGVNLLERQRAPGFEAVRAEERQFLDFCSRLKITGSEGDAPIGSLELTEFAPSEVTLFLTTRCNLRCTYCYANGGETRPAVMDLKTACRGIDYACQNALARGLTEFGVGYHGGGEPTQNWPVLSASFAYARQLAQQHGLRVYGSMATNAVLSPEKIEWIVQNFEGVNVSVDGRPAVQDAQRPTPRGKPSSPAVERTLRAFDRASFAYGMRLTVTAAAVESLPQSVAYLLEHYHPKRMQIEPVYDLGRGKTGAQVVEAQAFVQAYLQAKQIAAGYPVDFYYSAARVEVLTNRFCQSCGEGFSLTPQGLVSGCYEVPGEEVEFGEAFLLGHFDETNGAYVLDTQKIAALRRQSVEHMPWCQGCFCMWHCGGDCIYKAKHAQVDGKFLGDPRCEITRALTLDQILEKIQQNGGVYWAG